MEQFLLVSGALHWKTEMSICSAWMYSGAPVSLMPCKQASLRQPLLLWQAGERTGTARAVVQSQPLGHAQATAAIKPHAVPPGASQQHLVTSSSHPASPIAVPVLEPRSMAPVTSNPKQLDIWCSYIIGSPEVGCCCHILLPTLRQWHCLELGSTVLSFGVLKVMQ